MSDERYAKVMTVSLRLMKKLGARTVTPRSATFDFDVLVIGSGFGGSVTALRLTEKGYRVGVLEAGARFEDEDFAGDLLGPQALPLPPGRRAATASSGSTWSRTA